MSQAVEGPIITLQKGKAIAKLDVEGFSLNDASEPRVSLSKLGLLLLQGKRIVGLDMLAGLAIYDARGNVRVGLGDPQGDARLLLVDEQGKGSAGLYAGTKDDRPSLDLSDGQGYKAVLGGARLTSPATGETTQRSAASLVFFGPDKKVIWSAP